MKPTRKELLYFFLIAFGWMWGINLPRILATFGWIEIPGRVSTLMGYIALFGPGIAGFVMTGIRSGKLGMNALWRSGWQLDFEKKWLLPAILLVPVSGLLTWGILTLLDRPIEWQYGAPPVMLVPIGLLSWPGTARLVRGQFLYLRQQEFVTAARCLGVRDGRVIFVHILPNTIGPVVVAATFGVASAILMEAGLSFLGLGVQPPTPSWGNMLRDAQTLTILETMPWMWVPPGLMIVLSVLSINFIGDGLRDALDPRALLYKSKGVKNAGTT